MAYIGDRLFDDVVYANKNKMVSIWLREEFSKEDMLK
jgi:predicted HAD superfamily phosphohydrolase YqeG